MNPEQRKAPQATRESALAMYNLYQWMFNDILPPFEVCLMMAEQGKPLTPFLKHVTNEKKP